MLAPGAGGEARRAAAQPVPRRAHEVPVDAVSLLAAPGWLISPRVWRGHIPSDEHSRVMVTASACPSSANQAR